MTVEKTGTPSVKRMIEDVVGCKWSLSVIDMVKRGINRPGAMVREEDGLTTKVLNQRLAKLKRYGVLEKTIFPEVPPRVEYQLTDFGRSFVAILESIEQLQRRHFGADT
ncbi:winged helix-turn-helix transcriptional regulator [Acanthopleuribacter pedis]|uniref:Helix-turn-helix transcriptional regulator n=1 Tax=Acanthopleuribacter pedis TaxID=442870 RepID=A0A8J7PYI8_9BACT|nr:helix-turn-helix transcriptional regulator [Acanthopleuribacter pedis]